MSITPSPYSEEHMQRVASEVARMVDEVPLYASYGAPSGDISTWLAKQPVVGKRDLRRGFPKSLVRRGQDLNAAMHDEKVTLLATSGTTADRLQVIWEWTWWDPQEREAMRLNARLRQAMAKNDYREAVLTTPACGGGTCHIGDQSLAERTIDGMLFFNQTPDPSHWTEAECVRMENEWQTFAPRAVEADPAYLALLCRDVARRGSKLHAPEFVALTYETTTRAFKRDIARTIDAPLFQLYGATEAGVLFMECEHGMLHANERHAHIELLPVDDHGVARVIVTTLGREWMPLLRYEVGDVVRVAESAECQCGLPVNGPLLQRVEGRFSDCASVGEHKVSPLMLDDLIMASSPTIDQWQLAGDTLLCVGGDVTAAADAVSAVLERRVRGEKVMSIAPEASGKYRLVRDAR